MTITMDRYERELGHGPQQGGRRTCHGSGRHVRLNAKEAVEDLPRRDRLRSTRTCRAFVIAEDGRTPVGRD